MSRTFSTNCGSLENLKFSTRCGCNPKACQIRTMAVCDSPVFPAISRLLQWVLLSGIDSSVWVMTSSTCASVMDRGAPGRGSSNSPSSRPTRKRSRHLQTVAPVTCNFFATTPLLHPSSHPSTILARIASAWADFGRRSIAPEKLLRAQLLRMLYSVRSERLLMEEIDYSVLFRWFVGMNMDEPVWDATVFTKNRDRLLEHNVAKVFFAQVWQQAEQANLTSDEHFTVDGTLLEAAASLKSFQRKGEARHDDPDDPSNPTVNFHGEERSNDTHASNTDPDAQLARKGGGKEAKLSCCRPMAQRNETRRC